MSKNINNIYVRAITTSSGDVEYYLYNTKDCIGDHVENGLLETISEFNYEKNIKTETEINKEFSVKVIDSYGCESCLNKILPQVTPIYVTVTPKSLVELTNTMIIVTPTPNQTPIPEPTGTCYEITIKNTALNDSSNDLYIEKSDPLTGNIINKSYLLYDTNDGINEILIPICSSTYPSFRYGEFGTLFVPSSEININISDSSCQFDNECNIF